MLLRRYMAFLVLTAGRHSPSDGTLRAASEPREAPMGPGAGGDRRPNGWASFVGDVPEPPPPPRTATLRREKKVTILEEAVHRLWCWPTPPLPSPSSALSHGAAPRPRPVPGEAGAGARPGRGETPKPRCVLPSSLLSVATFRSPSLWDWHSLTPERDVSHLLRTPPTKSASKGLAQSQHDCIQISDFLSSVFSFLFFFPFFQLLLPCSRTTASRRYTFATLAINTSKKLTNTHNTWAVLVTFLIQLLDN